jgi:SNF2 family DNA or RNA helicase/SAM-dependent methyltransferase
MKMNEIAHDTHVMFPPGGRAIGEAEQEFLQNEEISFDNLVNDLQLHPRALLVLLNNLENVHNYQWQEVIEPGHIRSYFKKDIISQIRDHTAYDAAKEYSHRIFNKDGAQTSTLEVREKNDKTESISNPPADWLRFDEVALELGLSRMKLEALATRIPELRELKDYFFESTGDKVIYFDPAALPFLMATIEHKELLPTTDVVPTQVVSGESREDGYGGTSNKYDEAYTFEFFIEEPKPFEDIESLVQLFGPENALDILFATHPEYKGRPIDQLKSEIAEHLGNILLTPAPFSLDALIGRAHLLKIPELSVSLLAVIKQDCLRLILSEASKGNNQGQHIATEYFVDLATKAAPFGSSELDRFIEKSRMYYEYIFNIKLPSRVIGSIRDGRDFPDIYQRINIAEIEEHQRLLIADGMGTGKSASAILANECRVEYQHESRPALILVPSNVVSTWQSYLSDKVGSSGEPVGYFKSGQAPSVLIADQKSDYSEPEILAAYDYVIMTHERLSDDNVDALLQVPFGNIIIDEVHKLKNLKAGRRAKNLLRLAENNEHTPETVVMLSGTPVPNKVEDVAMVLRLLHPERFKKEDVNQLVYGIIHGDLLDLRSLLVPYMQMKSIEQQFGMPTLTEMITEVPLTKDEEEAYRTVLEDDEMTASEKITALRGFLLNHELLDVTPGMYESKIKKLEQRLHELFIHKDRIVVFVNDHIDGVLRGEQDIHTQLQIPEGVVVHKIHGSVSPEQRSVIQGVFQNQPGKQLLLVSGNTADVGVDFSAGQKIIVLNEPWTVSAKDQQIARVYREGVETDPEPETFLTPGTIEEGIHRYAQTKHRTVMKLLKGIPLTELEKEILIYAERNEEPDLEINAELAEFYFSAFDKLNKIYASVKEIGEQKFSEFIQTYGELYANSYRELGSRSYQSNASRVCATILERMRQAEGQVRPAILDLASGPEMLRRHSVSTLGEDMISMDINAEHFAKKHSENRGPTVVGGFSDINVYPERSFDYVNLSFAYHYTKFLPRKNEFERVELLRNIHRVLKPGGRLVLNMIHTLDFQDPAAFVEVVELLGFRLIDEYSGEITTGEEGKGDSYRSRLLTLERAGEPVGEVEDIMRSLTRADLKGFKFKQQQSTLVDSRKILKKFKLNGVSVDVLHNQTDRGLIAKETSIVSAGEDLKETYGNVKDIPRQEIIDGGFTRCLLGKRYILFKKISDEEGVVIIK